MNWQNMRLKQKIVGLAVASSIIPVIALLIITMVQKANTSNDVGKQVDQLGRENLAQIAKDVHGMCESANELLLAQTEQNLAVARHVLDHAGGADTRSGRERWTAVNQYTKAEDHVYLPNFHAGSRQITPNASFNRSTPVVDEVMELTGATCTIFQRMNDDGDMLRIATNVKKTDGERAIGTYIPARNPDGRPNPVISTVMNGETYNGRAYVVNQWYVTAYEPLRDRRGDIIGMLYVGVPLRSVQALREAVMDISVGEDGYVFVLGGKGDHRGSYIISKNGSRDGETIWGATDQDGNYFIQEMVGKATLLESNSVDYHSYMFEGREKIAALTYYGPWDWVIGAGAYADDFRAAQEQVNASLTTLIVIAAVGGVIIAVALSFLGVTIGRRIAEPIVRAKEIAQEIARGDMNAELEVTSRDEVGELAEAFQDMTSSLKAKSNAARQISRGNLSVDIDIASSKDELGESLQAVRESLQTMSKEAQVLVNAAVEGHLHTRADEQHFEGEYRRIVAGVNSVIDTLVGHIDAVPAPVMIIDTDFGIRYLNEAGAKAGGKTPDQLRGTKCYDFFKTSDCNTDNCACGRAMKTGRTESSETDAHPGGLDLEIAYTGGPVRDLDNNIIGALEIVADQTAVKKAQKKASKIADFQANEVEKISGTLERMAEGDLTVEYEIAEADEDTHETRQSFKGIEKGLSRTLDGLNDLLGQVAIAVEQVNSGSHQVSDSSQSLSQGATEQASSLEEVNASMSEMAAQVEQNAGNADEASKISNHASESAERGNGRMKEMQEAMSDISESSGEISKIIKVIDEIAFQTNLLALNAAVEAARAGVHGKGFAVVAEEVRNLAQRSAKAARETTELIEGSLTRVEKGTEIADATSAALQEIVEGIRKASDLVGEIAGASKEQAAGIKQVNDALSQVDEVTQANTSNAEESAAAAEELSGQASRLTEMIQRFSLRSGATAKAASTTLQSDVSSGWSDGNGRAAAPKKAKALAGATGGTTNDKAGHEVEPEDVINLDDDDFGEF
ncbi:HAMP domain-containing protein [bacterium]|nr:HAMP domain-containing protein [bacterium]